MDFQMNLLWSGWFCGTCHRPLSSTQKMEPPNAARLRAALLLKSPAKEKRPVPSTFTVSTD